MNIRPLESLTKEELIELIRHERRGEPVELCDCERGHNGIGIAIRECDCTGDNPHPAEPVDVQSDDAIYVLKLALEYWADRQQRYRNRAPVWVQKARALLAPKFGEEK